MAKHRGDVPVPQTALKGSSYYPAQDEYAVGMLTERKGEPPVRPATGDGQANEQNPSIARSMSRYRRNRRPPSGNAPTPTPAIPHPAYNQPMPVPLPDKTQKSWAADEERAREKHREDAMAQLTGEDLPSRPVRRHERSQKNLQPRQTSEPAPAKQLASQVDGRRHQSGARPASDEHRKSFLQKIKLSKSKETMNEPPPRYIGVGGGGIVPGTDAPVSAVNAGNRQVLVQYSDVSNHLVVTPSTRVTDLLQTASRELSPEIDPEKFILIESFRQVGLERSLRRYERVRDVMNSWTHDADNRLVVVPPSSMDALAQLDARQVPAEKPSETTVYLYHSQRPGKWDKRYVTLRPDGQVLIAKRENLKDSASICHLSDFDIYSPSARAMAKEIKPPKKICFAIKSQQKSSMFLSTEKFVHFFSSNDRAMADKWYRVVQRWRSWYLVNQLGVAEKAEGETQTGLPKRSLTQKSSRNPKSVSNEAPLVDILADPEPLLPFGAGTAARSRPSPARDIFSRKKSTREHAPPPSAFPKALALDTGASDDGPLVKGVTAEEIDASTFSPTGLLGRTYTHRRQVMEEREKRNKQDPYAVPDFVNESPSYSPSDPVHYQNGRTATMTSTAPPSGALNRNKPVSQSQSQKQKPLVDLTPVFQEPPQHTRKGRGVKVDPGTQLIDAATGPDLTPGIVNIPPATAWRRPSVDVSPQTSQSRYRSNTLRGTRHVPEPKACSAGSVNNSPSSPNNPFISNTLLSHSACRQATSVPSKPYTGHGVATGDRNATRPMLDMSPENPFAEGSLLRPV
ncbi:hypothetical protein N7532_007723 [Penicillium argentinense]|uniref:PH domain-containing protein n=1 Tax=Penicillium argentinense TaxID=1131581 RepID=A0A9W9K0X1_9EURO|nr:uncharacterized protein N7532_007723 [Penicillium argentinense]KAJ5089039.1 hypothetical protein N7532_007723 [Penicillium argentinense]